MQIISTPSNALQILLIGGITLLALISVATGVTKGIKFLSNANMVMAVGLLLFVMIAGPTMFLLREYVEGVGAYLQEPPDELRHHRARRGRGRGVAVLMDRGLLGVVDLVGAPFVGIFIARISRGRTVREFVVGVLVVPTAFSFLWFTVLGGTALYRELFGEGGLIAEAEDGLVVDETVSLFVMLAGLPGGTVLAVWRCCSWCCSS